AQVVTTGYGPVRSAAAAARIAGTQAAAVAVGGVAGALTEDLRVGDLVVASEVTNGSTTVSCPSAPLLAGELRRLGLRVRVGPIATVSHLVRNGERAALAGTGAIAVDMESAALLAGAAGRPAVVLRAISDTPAHPLVSPRTVPGGLAALRSLRQAAPALARWGAAAAPRRVLLASPRSFCAGVERAIEIVELALEQRGAPLYVRKQIVHNATVVADLEQRGAIFVDELSEVPDGASVVFSAHGVSPDVRREADRRGLDAVDATCPLVAKVHAEARRYAADGYLVALIGHAGHEEVDGTLGEAPGAMALVERPADVTALRPADPSKVAYLMQTTLSADEAASVVDAITERFPAATGPGTDDICYATTNRQAAVRTIAAQADVVLVAGSANSSNSLRLVETAQRGGAAAYLVDRADDIQLGWLAGASTVGITAGASAPPAIVDEIVAALGGLGAVTTEEMVVATESVQFGLPKELRRQPVGSAEN
ncbi:MAG: 4-hydroxy-3-methylbut-2-enyl diphosphate reductase, partial [Actinobacteria bacterium]|nr:4-hydroxy-3-methylbut-2-enyl diphosphate reductase [Actinomycetota bacterium]